MSIKLQDRTLLTRIADSIRASGFHTDLRFGAPGPTCFIGHARRVLDNAVVGPSEMPIALTAELQARMPADTTGHYIGGNLKRFGIGTAEIAIEVLDAALRRLP